MRRRSKQLQLDLRTWGGKRRNAGRKPAGRKAGVSHRRRERVTRHTPIHVTLKLRPELRSLRTKVRFRAVRQAFIAARERNGMRLTQFSVQRDHIHLIVEAREGQALSRGVQGLSIRIARRLNRALGRSGKVFADRFHAHVLRTPREARHALCYVLNNARRHAGRWGKPVGWSDSFASTKYFGGWRDTGRKWKPPPEDPDDPAPVVQAEAWLLTTGWKRYGRIARSEIPGPRPRQSRKGS